MVASLTLAIALWPVEVTQHCPPLNDTEIVGVAYNNNNDFLYCEWFTNIDEKKIQVNYVHGSEIFAVKDLDFSASSFIPSVNQLDSRTGEVRQANINNSQIVLQYRENKDQKTETTSLAVNKVDVLDAGFNNFVQSHWNKLVAGNALTVNFGSIAHQKTLPLLISVKPKVKCENIINKGLSQAEVCFMVEIDNVVLRMLIGNIKLIYDQQHRLQEFNGTVNVRDNKQKSQSAIIHYFYRDDYIATARVK